MTTTQEWDAAAQSARRDPLVESYLLACVMLSRWNKSQAFQQSYEVLPTTASSRHPDVLRQIKGRLEEHALAIGIELPTVPEDGDVAERMLGQSYAAMIRNLWSVTPGYVGTASTRGTAALRARAVASISQEERDASAQEGARIAGISDDIEESRDADSS